jgi:hypothetical protein
MTAWSDDVLAAGAAIAARAITGVSQLVDYRLGAGGRDPASPTPANDEGDCDCSGFVAWCLGISRKVAQPAYVRFNGGWLSTDGMVHDALTVGGILDQVPSDDDAAPGDVVVYGNGPRIGHCGIIIRTATRGATYPVQEDVAKALGMKGWDPTKPRDYWEIAHCAAGSPVGHAIRVTSWERFARGATSAVHLLRHTGWRP